jgi:hypothetical protein
MSRKMSQLVWDIRLEQPQLATRWPRGAEVGAVERRPFAGEAVLFCEQAERLLDLLGDRAAAAHPLAELAAAELAAARRPNPRFDPLALGRLRAGEPVEEDRLDRPREPQQGEPRLRGAGLRGGSENGRDLAVVQGSGPARSARP